jgi:hypothetical protein
LVKNNWTELTRLVWGDLLKDPEKYFGIGAFYLYDIDLNWVLEYQPQEISRFGRMGK